MKNSMRKKDIGLVFLERKKFSTGHFLIRWRRNEVSFPRVAFAFPRTIGNAVLRNRCKRRLREVVRNTPSCHGLDMVFFANKPLGQLTAELWRKELQRVIRCCEENNQHPRTLPH